VTNCEENPRTGEIMRAKFSLRLMFSCKRWIV